MEKIKKLAFYDFDGTLMNSPEKEEGKEYWKEKTGEEYPHIGWWGRRESLDTNVFDIKPFESILRLLKKDYHDPNTYVVLLTNRMKKLEPEVKNILDLNNIDVDEINTKIGDKSKSDRIIEYLEVFPNVTEINVYDDMEDQIEGLKTLKEKLSNIKVSVYRADNGKISLVENKLFLLIKEEVDNFLKKH